MLYIWKMRLIGAEEKKIIGASAERSVVKIDRYLPK
jgi:hypothetical protein